MKKRRRHPWLRSQEGRTAAIGVLAGGVTTAVLIAELGRVWRRGRAPLPSETDAPVKAGAEAVAETVEVAVAGFQQAPARESVMFNLLGSFAVTFAIARAITFGLRSRPRLGPFRNVRLGRLHVHHFVPGIVLAFVAGAIAIVTHNERIEPRLATMFGIGMGLTLDESALLLELDDVYWDPEGLLSVQIALAVVSFLGALILGARFLRRGEELVLPGDA